MAKEWTKPQAGDDRPDPAESNRPPIDAPPEGRAAAAAETPGPSGTWLERWGAFAEVHRAWWHRVDLRYPAYTIPLEIIEVLTRATTPSDSGHRSSRALISGEDAESERAFVEVCKDYPDTVGVWEDRPVSYGWLTSRVVRLEISEELMKTLKWNQHGSIKGLAGSVEKGYDRLPGPYHQLLGYAGRLAFDEQFRREKAELEARWWNLPGRPPLPLNANVADQPPIPVGSIEPDRDQVLGGDVERFLIDFTRFMRKWWLSLMVTWDLPAPQGPLDQAPLELQRTILGPDHRASSIPAFYDIPSTTDLRESIREQQRRAGASEGIEMEFPVTDTSSRDGHASQYESAFRMWLIERAVRSRYGDPRGLVARLRLGFSELLGISERRVDQLRQIYLEFLEFPD